MTPRELDTALAELSQSTEPPTDYLGRAADGLALDAIAIPDAGEGNVEFLHGPWRRSRPSAGDGGGGTNPVLVMTDSWNGHHGRR